MTEDMPWNHRVLRHPDGHLALHEVYYDKAGKPINYTANPIHFAVDEDEGLPGLISSLELALRDAKERPILDLLEIEAEPRTEQTTRRRRTACRK